MLFTHAGDSISVSGQTTRSNEAIQGRPPLFSAHRRPQPEIRSCSLLDRMGIFAAFIASFERAIQIAPSCAYAHAQMGRSFVQLNRHQEAVDELLRAFRMNPKYEQRREYLLALGSAYGHMGLMQESVAAYQKASELFPNDSDSVHGYGWALSSSKRFVEAEPVLRRAIALAPKNADAHYELGVVLGAQERFKDAAAEFQIATTLEPTKSNPHCGLGSMYRELQQFDAAADSLNEAIRIAPNDPDAYVQIGTVYGELREWPPGSQAATRLPAGRRPR